MAKNDFFYDLKRGRQGEVFVMNAFRNMNYEVTDVTKNQSYQKKDIDLLIKANETTYAFEVKSDWTMNSTKNILLEMRNEKTGKDGWFRFTEATHLAFVDMHTGVAYICRTQELRDFVEGEILLAAANGGVSSKIQEKHLGNFFCLLVDMEAFGRFQKVRVF